jgi:hypothetical protein
MFAQRLEGRHDVRVNVHLVSGTVEDRKCIVHKVGNVPRCLRHLPENDFSQESKVMGLLPVCFHRLEPQFVGCFRRVFLSNLGEMLCQPGPEFSFGPADDRFDRPEGIVEIERYGTDSVQDMSFRCESKTIVVL